MSVIFSDRELANLERARVDVKSALPPYNDAHFASATLLIFITGWTKTTPEVLWDCRQILNIPDTVRTAAYRCCTKEARDMLVLYPTASDDTKEAILCTKHKWQRDMIVRQTVELNENTLLLQHQQADWEDIGIEGQTDFEAMTDAERLRYMNTLFPTSQQPGGQDHTSFTAKERLTFLELHEGSKVVEDRLVEWMKEDETVTAYQEDTLERRQIATDFRIRGLLPVDDTAVVLRRTDVPKPVVEICGTFGRRSADKAIITNIQRQPSNTITMTYPSGVSVLAHLRGIDTSTLNLTHLAGQTQPVPFQNSGLSNLPVEIRQRIYALAMPEDKRVVIHPPKALDRSVHKMHGAHIEPGILQTCRAIRQEAMPIFYAQNHFLISIPPLISPVSTVYSALEHVKDLIPYMDRATIYTRFEYVHVCPGHLRLRSVSTVTAALHITEGSKYTLEVFMEDSYNHVCCPEQRTREAEQGWRNLVECLGSVNKHFTQEGQTEVKLLGVRYLWPGAVEKAKMR